MTCIYPGFIATELTKKNSHPMPFLLTAEDAANRIVRAIEQKKEVAYFPLVPSLMMSLLRRLPRKLYYFLMKKNFLKLRQHE